MKVKLYRDGVEHREGDKVPLSRIESDSEVYEALKDYITTHFKGEGGGAPKVMAK